MVIRLIPACVFLLACSAPPSSVPDAGVDAGEDAGVACPAPPGDPLSPTPLPSFDWGEDVADEARCALRALDSVIKDARLVCSGEGSHGVSQSSRGHALLARHWVLDLGFRQISFEATGASVDAWSRYVEEGNEADLSAGFGDGKNSLVDAVEYEKLIRALRDIRLELPADDHLVLSGFDVAVQPTMTKASLFAFLQRVQPDEVTKWKTALANASYAADATAAAQLDAQLDAKKDAYIAASDLVSFQRAKRDVLNLEDGYNFLVYYAKGDFWTGDATYREPGMIRNVTNLLASGSDRIMLIAHDSHCAKDNIIGQKADSSDSPALGTAIASSSWGPTFKVVAQLYFSGSERMLAAGFPVQPLTSPSTNVEGVLATVSTADRFTLATTSTATDFTKARSFNFSANPQVPKSEYDAFIFLRNVTPTTLR